MGKQQSPRVPAAPGGAAHVWSYVFSVGLLAAVLAPAFRSANQDSFPFSTYPMFAHPRPKPKLFFMEGLDAGGTQRRIPPHFVANQEVMQAAQIVQRAALGGTASRDRLCKRVAERVAADPTYQDVVRVQLVRASFDTLRYFTVSPEPEQRRVYGRCEVPRAP
jgi:hypothetical protein